MGIRLLAIGLIAGLAAGCTSSHAEPKPSPTPTSPVTSKSSASPSATPSRTGPLTTGPNVRPGEKPPVYPELAKQHTANGALAFAIYYFKAFDWGYATDDPFLVQQISDPRCKGCGIYIKGLESLQRNKERLRAGRITFDSASICHGTLHIAAEYAIDVAVDEQAVTLVKPDGSTKTVARATKNNHSLVFVRWRGSSWTVVEVTVK